MNIIRYQSVQVPITLSAAGKVIFPDVQNLRGACIQKVNIFPEEQANFALQGGQASPCTLADINATTITLVSGSDEKIKDAPAIMFVPYQGGTTANGGVWETDNLQNLLLDWNKCYLNIWQAPSSNPTYLNIGVWYFYPTNNAGQ